MRFWSGEGRKETGFPYLVTAVLGIIHGLADCISGMMLGFLPEKIGLGETASLILLYNVLAFAGQLPAGVLVDRIGNPRMSVFISITLIASGMLLFAFTPLAGVILLGTGSGLFHVSGGMVSLMLCPNRADGPGIFAAPGVIGLAVGGFLAISGVHAEWILLGGLGALSIVIAFLPFPVRKSVIPQPGIDFDSHDLLMVLMLAAIAMRSAVWNVFQLINEGDYVVLIPIGFAAFAGKLLGGFAADRFGWKNYSLFALLLSGLLLSFSGKSWLFLFAGVGLLQSATPVAIAAMHRWLPAQPATAAGLSLGLALAFGGIPFFMGLSPGDSSSWWPGTLTIIAALIYYFVLKKSKNRTPLENGSNGGTLTGKDSEVLGKGDI